MAIPELNGASPEPIRPQPESEPEKIDNFDSNSIWAKFNDTDNKVDLSDVSYVANNNKLRSSSDIRDFLTRHKGESWTAALKNEVKTLIERFNLECEGDELMDELDDPQSSFDKTRNRMQNEFNNFKKAQKANFADAGSHSTGSTFSVMNDDGTSYQINSAKHTITKYSNNGQIIEQRAMTPDEKSLSSQDLITKLQSSAGTPQNISNVQEGNNSIPERKIKGKGIIGSYQLTDNEKGGYNLQTNFTVVSYQNPAARAFGKGFTDAFAMDYADPDENGNYCFRNLKAKTYSAFR